MIDTYAEVKKRIVSEILLAEEQRRSLSVNAVKLNTPEYYRPFEILYNADSALFTRALNDLRNTYDDIYECLRLDKNERFCVCSERIIIHVLLLQLYFDIEVESIPSALRQLLFCAIEKRKGNSWQECMLGYGLYQAVFWFISSVTENDEPIQLFQPKERDVKALFIDFISLEEVTSVEMANIYRVLYRAKLVLECPLYIRQALKAAYLYDIRLVSICSWEEYIYKCSPEKIQKDILLLKSVGFAEIPVILGRLVTNMEHITFSPSIPKKEYCAKLIARNKIHIERVIEKESSKSVIDRFLGGSNKKN